ncbi:MAG: hypothetical protein Q9159_003213 [Coniocarpon cinnabarinum]
MPRLESTARAPGAATKGLLRQAAAHDPLTEVDEHEQQLAAERRRQRSGAAMQWHLPLNDGGRAATAGRDALYARRSSPNKQRQDRGSDSVPFAGRTDADGGRGAEGPGDEHQQITSPQLSAAETAESSNPDSNSTLTERERRKFRSLFDKLTGDSGAGRDFTVASNVSKDSKNEMDAIDPRAPKTSNIFKTRPISARPWHQLSEASFPAELKAMAAQAQRAVERRRQLEAAQVDQKVVEESWEPAVREVEQEMHHASTDAELWSVLHNRVLDPLRSIDAEIGRRPINAGEEFQSISQPSNSRMSTAEPHPIVMGYSLLPTIKSHCWTTSVLGPSTQLYNELIGFKWRVRNDVAGVSALLWEMNQAGLEADQETLATLEQVCLWLTRARRGQYGIALQLVEDMLERQRDVREVMAWRDEIKRRLDEIAVRLSHRKERERELGLEGAF